jgi:thiamine biosynthesis lipoprotein
MMRRHALASASFPAMGATVTVGGVSVPAEEVARGTRLARNLAGEWEARFSRFRPDSELQAVNAGSGKPIQASGEFIALLELAIEGVRRSAGRFNPAVLPALESAGYDRSFETIGTGDASRQSGISGPVAVDWIDDVAVDRARGTVRLPQGVRLDFGGIAKGAYVDRLTNVLRQRWPGGYVDAGGDLRVWGTPPNGLYWTAGIQDPRGPAVDIAVARMYDSGAQAVATSGTYKRRWPRGDAVAHHLIDPKTGSSLPERATSVTAFAAATAGAEVETKSLLVAAARGEPLAPQASVLAVVYYEGGNHAVIETLGQRSAEIVRDTARAST